jgi:hypothetical protein
MALTVENVREPFVPKFISCKKVKFPASYTSGGEAFTPSTAGFREVEFVFPVLIHGDEAKSSEQFISGIYYEGEKLHLVNAKSGKEVEAGKNTEKVEALVLCFGRTKAK